MCGCPSNQRGVDCGALLRVVSSKAAVLYDGEEELKWCLLIEWLISGLLPFAGRGQHAGGLNKLTNTAWLKRRCGAIQLSSQTRSCAALYPQMKGRYSVMTETFEDEGAT